MTLREHFDRSGAWLFARRSYVPLAMIPLTALLMLVSRDYPTGISLHFGWKVFCLIISFLGEGIRSIAVGTSAPFTSGRNTGGQLADTINTTGIYSVIRHPLYVGNFVTIFGIALWTGVWWFLILVSVLYWFYYERIIFTEEQFLEFKFPSEFREFARKTPAVIPSFRHYVPARLPFSFKIVLAREYDGVLAIVSAFLLLEAMEYTFANTSAPVFHWFWLILFVATFIVTAFLRYARKHTSLLSVAGR